MSDLRFETVIQDYLAGSRFIRRDWLTAEVMQRAAEPGCRFVILIAEPGSGKSTFIAQLAHDIDDALVYFLRRNQTLPLGEAGTRAFLTQLGYQLAAQDPSLFAPEQIRLVVEQDLHFVGPGAEVVGGEVGRLLASPFYQNVLRISQRAGRVKGHVIGLRIEELVADPGLLSSEQLLTMALTAPARALEKRDPTRRICILVDALDEIVSLSGGDDLLTWLTNVGELPSNIRWILTTRPLQLRVAAFVEKQAARARTITLDHGNPWIRRDSSQFARRLLAEPAIRDAVVQIGQSPERFEKKLVEKAAGNLGFLDAFARSLSHAIQQGDEEAWRAFLLVDELPDDLIALYGFFLRQLLAKLQITSVAVEDPETAVVHYINEWTAAAMPILRVLTVAFEALSPSVIRYLGQIRVDQGTLAQTLDHLRPFLTWQGQECRLYHSSLNDFLSSERTANAIDTAPLYVQSDTAHRSIALRFWRDFEATGNLPFDYGIRTLARHLREAGEVDRLVELINSVWLKLRYAHDRGAYVGFLADLDLAWSAALMRKKTTELFHLHAVRLHIGTRTLRFDDGDFRMLALLGRRQEAIARARSSSSPLAICAGLIEILSALPDESPCGQGLQDEVDQLLMLVDDLERRAVARAHLADLLVTRGRKAEARHAYRKAVQDTAQLNSDGTRARSLVLVGLSMARQFPGEGARVLANGLRTARKLREQQGSWMRPQGFEGFSARDEVLLDVALMCTQHGTLDEAESLAAEIHDRVAGDRVRFEIVCARVDRGELDAAEATARRITWYGHRADSFRILAAEKMYRGERDAADEFVNGIDRDSTKDAARADLAVAAAAAGDAVLSEKLLLAVADRSNRALAYLALAVQYRASSPDQAETLVRRAEKEMEGANDASFIVRAAYAWALLSNADQAVRRATEAASPYTGSDAHDDTEDSSAPVDLEREARAEALLRQIQLMEKHPGWIGQAVPEVDAKGTPQEVSDRVLATAAAVLASEADWTRVDILLPYIVSAASKARVYRLAAEHALDEDPSRAKQYWEKSESYAPTSGPGITVPFFLATVAAQIGNERVFDSAEALAVESGSEALALKVQNLACQAGKLRHAERLAEGLRKQSLRVKAFVDLTIAFTTADRSSDAERAFMMLNDTKGPERDRAAWALAVLDARAGNAERAFAYVESIEDGLARYNAVGGVVVAFAEQGDIDRLEESFYRLSITENERNLEAWCRAVLNVRSFQTAREVVLRLDPSKRDSVISEITTLLGRQDRLGDVDTLLDSISDRECLDQTLYLLTVEGRLRHSWHQLAGWTARIVDPLLRAICSLCSAAARVLQGDAEGIKQLSLLEKEITRMPKPARFVAYPTLAWASDIIAKGRGDKYVDALVKAFRYETGNPAAPIANMRLALEMAGSGDARAIKIMPDPADASLFDLASALCDSRLFDAAEQVALAEVFEREATLMHVASQAVAAHRFDQAQRLRHMLEYRESQDQIGSEIASAMVGVGRISDAILSLSDATSSGFAQEVSQWSGLDAVEPALYRKALTRALKVATWEDPGASRVLEVLATEGALLPMREIPN